MWRDWSKKVPADRLFFYARQFFPENGTFFNILRGHIQEVSYAAVNDSLCNRSRSCPQMLPLAVISPQTFRSEDEDAKEFIKVHAANAL